MMLQVDKTTTLLPTVTMYRDVTGGEDQDKALHFYQQSLVEKRRYASVAPGDLVPTLNNIGMQHSRRRRYGNVLLLLHLILTLLLLLLFAAATATTPTTSTTTINTATVTSAATTTAASSNTPVTSQWLQAAWCPQ